MGQEEDTIYLLTYANLVIYDEYDQVNIKFILPVIIPLQAAITI
ncbi:hypothetical protein HMPREF0765_3503 [Sphingobacterium spiritivorum ATCC 33300]|uniref:Uncharacterized protein n=1 Tax=Sphingobacterium spiritivorum ATCC 33300 TaxID=525372 RepID=C2G1P7_SPHSI|nr:hypothetical protein HMPREF0765_3503 [Sphingobacterium spiritivorum ATCC 33300]